MMQDGFDVNDSVEIEDIDGVKQTKNLIPVTSNVLLELSKVVADTSKDKLSKTINLSFKLVNGIEVNGEPKYVGSLATSFPQRVTYWVDSGKVQQKINAATKTTTANWWKNKQYLVEFKQLLIASGIDPKLDEFKIDGRLQVDSLITALKGKVVLGNITQREETAFDNKTGDYKPLGTFLNEVKNLRKAG